MQKQHGKKLALVAVFGNVALVLLGLAIALAVVEMAMRAFPNSVPAEVRVNPPARRIKAFLDETYDLRQSDGDLFHYMRGSIAPLSPDQDTVIAQVHMVTDANGFRNSPPEKATYDVVALGDSFTRASGVASPWPQKLAEYAGKNVLNLGDVGFGPQDELRILQQYGLKKQPHLVILAYFEGNDLYDAASYERATPLILFRFARYALNRSLEAWRGPSLGAAQAEAAPDYLYPVRITINNRDLETAFLSYYLSWLSVDREAIETSQDFRLTSETILRMRELSEEAGAQFLLVYVPSKEHVYLPYLTDADTLARVFADVPTIELDETGFLQFVDGRATPELTRQQMDAQARLLADFAVDNNIRFLDLTPIFHEEAGRATELYYPFDTHWNQLGHDLAAQSINAYIQEMLSDASDEAAGP